MSVDNFATILNSQPYDEKKLLDALSKDVPAKSLELELNISAHDALKAISRKLQDPEFSGKMNSAGLRNLSKLCLSLKEDPSVSARQRSIVKIFTEGTKNPHFVAATKAIEKQQIAKLKDLFHRLDTGVIDKREVQECIKLIPDCLHLLSKSEREQLFNSNALPRLLTEVRMEQHKGVFNDLCVQAYKVGKLASLLEKTTNLTTEETKRLKETIIDTMRLRMKHKVGFVGKLLGARPSVTVSLDQSASSPAARNRVNGLLAECALEVMTELMGKAGNMDALHDADLVKSYALSALKMRLDSASGKELQIEIPKQAKAQISEAIEHSQKVYNRFENKDWIVKPPLFQSYINDTQNIARLLDERRVSPNSNMLKVWATGAKSLESQLIQAQKDEFRQELAWLLPGTKAKMGKRLSGDDRFITEVTLGKAYSLLEKAKSVRDLEELRGVMDELRAFHSRESPWAMQEQMNELKRSITADEFEEARGKIEDAKRLPEHSESLLIGARDILIKVMQRMQKTQ